MSLHQEGLCSENINEIASALAKAQAEVEGAVEDKVNPHFKSSYSSLYSIWTACKTAISNHGLCVTQPTNIEGDILMLHTILMHSSGQWIRSKTPVSAAKMTPQAIGSAITYMRRYSLAAIVGVAPGEDDDGNAAEDKTHTREVQTVKVNLNIKDPGYDAFVERLELDNGVGKEYVKMVAEKMRMSEIQVINSAMKREERFMEGLKKWSDERETTSNH